MMDLTSLYLVKLYDGQKWMNSYAGTEGIDSIVNLFSYNVIRLPSKSSGFVSSSNLEKESNRDSSFSCGILNQTTENIFSLGNTNDLVKCLSLVISTLCSDLENSANLPFESSFGLDIMSTPCCLRNLSNLLFTFSSLRNLTERDAKMDIFTTSQDICRILKSCQNMFFSNSWVIIEDIINAHSSSKHFQYLPDHYSSAFEGRDPATDFSVNNNIVVDFDSHGNMNNDEIYKTFGGDKMMEKDLIRRIGNIFSFILGVLKNYVNIMIESFGGAR